MLDFLYVAVSWVLLRWHDLFTLLGLGKGSGVGWALSIIFLVITARLLLFRLFVKQVHYTRNMQKMQPKIQKLRDKYKNDRTELNRQMMALQQEEGFNPLSGCLPMVLQIPVFLGLFHVLRHLSNSNAICRAVTTGKHISNNAQSLLTQYTFSSADTCRASQAKIFGTPLAASFHDSGTVIKQLGGSDPTTARVVLVILLIISAAATLGTQLLVRASQTTTPEGTQATIQKAMLYIIPLGTLASGLLFNFPLGVLLYWFTSNLWTLGQQAYIIRFHPPTAEPVVATGQLGKTLAPKPGQRPVRMTKSPTSSATSSTAFGTGDVDASPSGGRPNGSANGGKAGADAARAGSRAAGGAGTSSSTTADGARADTSTASVSASAPRPGQRPNRPNGKRPPAKRPTQAKKRR